MFLGFVAGIIIATNICIVTLWLATKEDKPKEEKEKTIAPKCDCKKCKHCESVDKDSILIYCDICGRTCIKKQCRYFEKGE